MKSIIFTLVAFLCAQSQEASAQQQRIRIGHRDANQAPILDIGIAHIQPNIVQSLSLLNCTNIRVVSLDISDNAFNPFYYASIGIGIVYQEQGSSDFIKINLLYPIIYDASLNAYYGGQPNFAGIQDGGSSNDKNPDNNFCVARNCIGCATLRDLNGKTLGCSPCAPTNTDVSYYCIMESTSGMGGARILNALGGILKGLISLL